LTFALPMVPSYSLNLAAEADSLLVAAAKTISD
jgi:hypothetical protein